MTETVTGFSPSLSVSQLSTPWDTGYQVAPPLPPRPVLGLLFPEKKVLELVRAVTEDDVYFSIEFNEFLKMISRKESEHLQLDCLVEAFRTFDLKNAGFVRSERVVKVLEGKMSRRDIEQMMALADTRNDGRIDYQG